MLRSLNEKVGTYDEEDEFKMLEELLQSSHFMKAKSVSSELPESFHAFYFCLFSSTTKCSV